MLDYIVLGMVLHEGLTGYDIKKEMESSIGNFYKASYGSLYPTLKKLTDKEHLSMSEEMQGSRQKKYYKATEEGRAIFLEWLSSPIDLNASGDAQLAQIFFYGELPKEIRDKRLQEYEFFIKQGLQQFQALAKGIPDEGLSEIDYYGISTLYLGIQSAHNTLRWLKHIKDQKPFSEFLYECEE
jgi:DNA-binding PadR family transcriptional regulator